MRAVEPSGVAALIPCHRQPPAAELVDALAVQLGAVLIVDDGMPPAAAAALDRLADACGAAVLRLAPRRGKGHAVAAGIEALRSAAPAPEAVFVIDSDGQHPPNAVHAFLAASATADLVIGDRFAGPVQMPLVRRMANRIASRVVAHTSGAPIPDSQCGMRLLRGRALHEIEFPCGGMEAETRHLKRCLRAGVPVAWVPIPALLASQPSFVPAAARQRRRALRRDRSLTPSAPARRAESTSIAAS